MAAFLRVLLRAKRTDLDAVADRRRICIRQLLFARFPHCALIIIRGGARFNFKSFYVFEVFYMHFRTTSTSSIGPQSINNYSRALNRQAALMKPLTLSSRESSPQAVQAYFDGEDSCDLSAVHKWAVDNGEANLLKQLANDGFQGLVCVSSVYSLDTLELAIKSELPIEFKPGIINSSNVIEVIEFLRNPVQIEVLHLDISSDIDLNLLHELLQALDALSDLKRLEVKVDGSTTGPLHPDLSWNLAGSSTCLRLSATARSLILSHVDDFSESSSDDDTPPGAKHVTHQRAIQWLENSAEKSRAFARQDRYKAQTLPLGARRSDAEARAAWFDFKAEVDEMDAAYKAKQANVEQLSSQALLEFLEMASCPETGLFIRNQFVDVLAHIALDHADCNLLRAVGVLAPDYSLTFRSIMPSEEQMDLIIGCKIPCNLEIRLTEQRVEQFDELMEYCGDAFSKLDLRLNGNFSEDSAGLLINAIASLKDVKKLSLTFEERVNLDFSEADMGLDLSDYSVNADSLILRGSEKSEFPKVLLKIIQPSSLSLDLITPSGAADLLASFMEKKEKMGSLNELHICCSISDDEPQEFLLLEVVKNSIKIRPGLNILIQSNFPLFTDEKEKTELIQATRKNPVENMRMESYLQAIDDWQSYLQINSSLHAKAQAYFGLLGLPQELGTHAVNGGSFTPADGLTLNAANAIFTQGARTGQKPTFDATPPEN